MTLTKPKLAIVPQEPAQPYDEAKGLERIKTLRRQLERAAIRFVIDGKTLSAKERLIKISDIAGIPRGVLELAMRENKK